LGHTLPFLRAAGPVPGGNSRRSAGSSCVMTRRSGDVRSLDEADCLAISQAFLQKSCWPPCGTRQERGGVQEWRGHAASSPGGTVPATAPCW